MGSCIVNQNANSEEERGEEGNEASTRRMHDREKPPVPSIIQSFPPLSAIQVCIPAEVGKGSGERDTDGARVSCRVIVPDDRGCEVVQTHTAVVLLSNVGVDCSAAAGFGAYRGRDSTGRVNKKPFSSAAFSPCLPNPSPLLEVVVVDLDTPLSPVSFRGMCLGLSKTLDTKWGGSTPTALLNSMPFSKPPRTGAGRTSLARSFQAVMERRGLPFARKIRPTSMFTHPREKRKKAETRVKLLT